MTEEHRIPTAWFARGLLVLASLVLLALAGASAWLSYRAQVAYVLAHNGEQKTQAQVWALLLDAGTGGVSLLRLYETLAARPGAATRVSLAGCITASVTMNLLHTPSRTLGGYVVAAVPPVMYALFLEHLLANLRSFLIPDTTRRGMWHSLILRGNFPTLMWCTWRGSLRQEADRVHVGVDGAPPAAHTFADCEAEQHANDSEAALAVHRPRRAGRGPGLKRVAFEAALVEQVRSGDLRLFSADGRERNAAAYQAAASLPAPLSRGAARRYVVQALPRFARTDASDTCSAPVLTRAAD